MSHDRLDMIEWTGMWWRHANDDIGDNRSPGLVELDGKVITVEERVQSICAYNKKENPDVLR